MSNEALAGSDSGELDMTQVEMGLAVLRKACDTAVDKLGGSVPGVQLRALLILADAGGSLDTRGSPPNSPPQERWRASCVTGCRKLGW